MKKIVDRLYVGEDFECFNNRGGWVTVHACKSPCHQSAVGYRGNLHSTHPHYLFFEEENNLYLNLVDPPIPLFKIESFQAFLKFTQNKYKQNKSIFIHCNRGESRAPSLALLFLAKILNKISNESYESSLKDFIKLCSFYNPGKGIRTFLKNNWNSL